MSRKKIAAATLTLAALGLGFAGYMQVTRANDDTDEHGFQAGDGAGHRAYLANHQSGHGAAIFKWAQPEEMSLPHSGSAEPFIGQCFYDSKEGAHALIGSGESREHGSSSDLPHVTSGGGSGHYAGNGNSRGSDGGDHWSGSNGGGWGSGYGDVGFGSGTAGKKHHRGDDSNNAPGSNNNPSNGSANPPGNTQGDSTPPGPGSNEPNAGDSPSNTGDSTQPSTDAPPGPGTNEPSSNDKGDTGEPGGPQNNPTPPGGPQGGDLPHSDPPPETHSVPEPGTLGLLAFGMAAAALRRRRRS